MKFTHRIETRTTTIPSGEVEYEVVVVEDADGATWNEAHLVQYGPQTWTASYESAYGVRWTDNRRTREAAIARAVEEMTEGYRD